MSQSASTAAAPKAAGAAAMAAEAERLREVVALVDGMADRGRADAILAPLRDKIAALRPARVMRFPRLLFVPFDGLITAPAKWRPTDLTLPRTVLRPIIEEVRERLPALAAETDAHLTTHQDRATQLHLGHALWPQAASLLADVALPRLWSETELPTHLYPAIGRAVVLVLRHAATIQDIATAARAGQSVTPQILALLNQMREPELPLIFAVMMCHLPEPEQLLRTVGITGAVPGHPDLPRIDAQTAQSRRSGAETATDTLLSQLERQAASGMLGSDGALAPEVTRIAGIITGIEEGAANAERKRRAQALRRGFSAVCQKRFTTDLSDALLRPALSLAKGGQTLAATSPQMAEVETAARRLRQFEAAARKLGDEAFYQAGLAAAAKAIAELPDSEAMDRVDRVRLVELFVGADAAMRLLQPAPR